MKNSIISDAHNLPKEETRWKESSLKINIEEQNIGLEQVQKLWYEQKLTDLQLAEELVKKMKNENSWFMQSFILENWNINMTKNVKEWFINFWQKMWFWQKNAITLLFKIIWEKYLNEGDITAHWLLLPLEFLEHDINNLWLNAGNWLFVKKWKSDENEEFDDMLLALQPDFQILKNLYPRLLWEIFWPEYEIYLKRNFLIQGFSKEDEDKIIEYYRQVDSIAENQVSEFKKLLLLKKENLDKPTEKTNFFDNILIFLKKVF